MTDLIKLDGLKGKIALFLEPIKELKVNDRSDLTIATGALTTVKAFQKEIEAHRVAYVSPLNEQVKSINGYAKELAAPLIASEESIKRVMATFTNAENQRIEATRKAELLKIQEEMKRKDAELRAEQARLEENRKKDIAEAEEKRKTAVIEQQEADKILNAFGIDDAQKKIEEEKQADAVRLSQIEHDQIAAKFEQDKIDLELRAAQDKARIEIEARGKEAALKAEKLKNTREVWKFEVTDMNLIPKDYWIINEKKIGEDVRGGIREIKGVRIFSEDIIIASRT